MSNPKIFEKVAEDIKKYGWHVLSVACEDAPNFSYSIGFEETLNHPEVIMSGLSTNLMHKLLNDIGELIKQGNAFKDGDLSNEVIDGFPVKFTHVNEAAASEYLRVAEGHYSDTEFRVLQCIWPDKEGVFQIKSNSAQEVLG